MVRYVGGVGCDGFMSAALAFRLQKIGYNFDKETLDRAYASFLQVADRAKEVHDKDLHVLVEKENLLVAN